MSGSGAIRIATYNIRSLRDDSAAVVRVLIALRAHVVCVQEAPRFLFWRQRCRRLAERSGLVVVAGGRAAGANLLLADPQVVVHRTREVAFTKDRGLHLRGAALAEVAVGTLRCVVAGTHLDGVEGPRLRHVDELYRALESFGLVNGAYVIGADVNAEPGSPTWQRLTRRSADAAATTSTGDPMTNQPLTPTRRIDALFVGPALIVRRTEAIESADVNQASDHRPVVADLAAG